MNKKSHKAHPYSNEDMNPISWKKLAKWELKANIILWLINGLLFLIIALISNNFQQLVSSMLLSKLTLLETGLIFLIGGIIAFSGSVSASKSKELFLKSNEQWSIEKLKTREKIANNYLILAIITLIVSIIISVLGL